MQLLIYVWFMQFWIMGAYAANILIYFSNLRFRPHRISFFHQPARRAELLNIVHQIALENCERKSIKKVIFSETDTRFCNFTLPCFKCKVISHNSFGKKGVWPTAWTFSRECFWQILIGLVSLAKKVVDGSQNQFFQTRKSYLQKILNTF